MILTSVEALVRDRIGLDVASLGSAAFPRAVENRMQARVISSVDAYAGLLSRDSAEWSTLIAELVVPETWFFRGGRILFEHLAAWVRDRSTERSPRAMVRVLSIPCSTGEEPYSLAIALEELGVPSTCYRIDGVDLSGDHLLRAVAGRYPAFSFRETGPDPRTRFFRNSTEARWELIPSIRETVRFRPGNLIDPGFLGTESPYDLILCRNLFIYLTNDAKARALSNLERLLAQDGRLCVTPAEADRLPSSQFVADGPIGLSVFRRPAKASKEGSGIVATTTPRSGPVAAAAPRTTAVSAPTPLREIVDDPPPAAKNPRFANPAEEVRLFANAGKLELARMLCERAIGKDPTATLYGLLGVIHLAAGRRDDAASAFRKALYLDPNDPESLTHMAVLCDQRGETGQAAALRHRLTRQRVEDTA